MCFFTIVTPSYNQGHFLENTIDSVLSQSYNKYEYIVIDGGSSDNSIEIIKKYQKYLKYWVSEKDKGQTDAINKGLRMATGNLVSWINSDDYYDRDALKIVASVDEHQSKDVYYGDYTLVNSLGKPFMIKKEIPFNREILLYGVNFIGQPASFFKRSLLSKYGFLNEQLNYMMDYEFWLRASFFKASFYHIPKNLAFYRYHSASKTVMYEKQFRSEMCSIATKYIDKKNKSYLIYKNIKARFLRQIIKIYHRHTVDFFGGPFRWLAYNRKR
jgi:glycosyltransferase involved in cell wall biosynthesis